VCSAAAAAAAGYERSKQYNAINSLALDSLLRD